MEIKEITNKEIWENFILQCENKTFLHSWNWGEFNLAMGDKIWRLGVFENDTILAAALIIKVQARRGNFLFCPHGPVFGLFPKKEILKTLVEKLKEIAQGEKVSFIRISPILPARRSLACPPKPCLPAEALAKAGRRSGEGGENQEENRAIFRKLGFRPAPMHMHAETTWMLDVTLSEDELLANMRKTTRYLIKKAQKIPELTILKGNRLEDLSRFNNLYQETAKRHAFVPFSLDYLTNQFRAFADYNQIVVFLAKYQEKIISGAVVLYYGGTGFYHHAASLPEISKIPASYLLQWEAIKEAKTRNCSHYDFWGYVSPVENPKHPWAGPTLFKMGFGGFKLERMHAQDLPLKPNYWITCAIESARRLKRNLR